MTEDIKVAIIATVPSLVVIIVLAVALYRARKL